MNYSSLDVLESWREHARDPYEFWQPRWITGFDINPDEVAEILNKEVGRLWISEGEFHWGFPA